MHLVCITVLMLLSLLLESPKLHLPKLWSTRSKDGGESIITSLPLAHEERQGIQSHTASLAPEYEEVWERILSEVSSLTVSEQEQQGRILSALSPLALGCE